MIRRRDYELLRGEIATCLKQAGEGLRYADLVVAVRAATGLSHDRQAGWLISGVKNDLAARGMIQEEAGLWRLSHENSELNLLQVQLDQDEETCGDCR